MIKVEKYAEIDEVQVVEFIRGAQADAEPDREILLRSVLIKDADDVVGMVSYEPHGSMGVVRYFLYDSRIAGTDLVALMFLKLYEKALSGGVKQLIAQASTSQVRALFEMLGFTNITGDLSKFIDMAGQGVEVMLINLEEKVSE